MSEKTVMLVCSAGISTSLLVKKMQDAAEKDGQDVKIFATAAADAENKFASEKPDVLMLGPQVSYMLDQFKASVDFPVEVINMRDYGLMNGEGVLKRALTLIDEK